MLSRPAPGTGRRAEGGPVSWFSAYSCMLIPSSVSLALTVLARAMLTGVNIEPFCKRLPIFSGDVGAGDQEARSVCKSGMPSTLAA